MKKKAIYRRGILATLIVILFLVAAITFPYAFNLTWSAPGASYDRSLTYKDGKLTWDSSAEIDESGAIKLSMFESNYGNVKSSDGSKVVAPKTGKETGVRLINAASEEISYTAVLYRTDDTGVPIVATLSGEENIASNESTDNESDGEEITLPTDVDESMVVDTKKGVIAGGKLDTVDITWAWRTAQGASDDALDTALARADVTNKVGYKLYITVEDVNNDKDKGSDDKGSTTGKKTKSKVTIVRPTTGDDTYMMTWFVLAVASLVVVSYLFVKDTKKEKQDKDEN